MKYNLRSNPDSEFKYLKDNEKPIYITCSDVFGSVHHDLISFILDIQNKEDENLQNRKKKNILELSKYHQEQSNAFFDKIYNKINNVMLCQYMGWEKKNISISQMINDYQFLYLHRIYFENKYSQVSGVIDGIIHRSLLKLLYGIDRINDHKNYYVVCIINNKMSDYYYYKALTQLYYFSRLEKDINSSCVICINKDENVHIIEETSEKISIIKNMIREIRKTKRLAPYFDINDITNIKYFPNMKISDKIWYEMKSKISFLLGEITQLWCCDDGHRQKALEHGIKSWRDDRFSPSIIGHTDPFKIHVLNRIIQVNRQNPCNSNFKWIMIENSFKDKWPNMKSYQDSMFIDFEYTQDYLYMIGVFFKNEYKAFWANDLSLSSEKKIIIEFNTFLQDYKDIDVWYWHAELYKWNFFCNRHYLFKEKNDTKNWHDLCHLMRTGTITVYGALDFSLKSVVSAFYKNKKIPFCYEDLECQNGKSSITFAENYYRNKNINDKILLEKYNHIDTEAMFHILFHIQSIMYS